MSLEGRSTLHPIYAEASGVEGWIRAELGPTSGEAMVEDGELVIPLGALSAGNPLYDAELHRRVDIRRYPTATGTLMAWEPTTEKGTYLVSGEVSFRGVTREAESHMRLSVEDDRTVVLDGSRLFDIRDFGMVPPRLLAVRVHPEVTIHVAVVARCVD